MFMYIFDLIYFSAPRVEMTIKSATVIMERFKIDKQKKVLPYNDEQIHKFEK